MSEKWRECTDPDELAAAVAAQMRVEKGGDLGTWDLTRFDTPDEFRSSLTAGYRFRVPRWWKLADEELVDAVAAVIYRAWQRSGDYSDAARAVLAAFPLAAQDGGGATGAERYLDGRMDDPEYARARCDALLAELVGALAERDELAARLAQVPEVPDGHELVVLPTETVDYYGENDPTDYEPGSVIYRMITAARAAIARRPVPVPDTERVDALDAIADKRLFRITEGELTTVVQCAGVRREPDGTLAVHGRDFYKGFATPVAPDGTVEVLRDGAR